MDSISQLFIKDSNRPLKLYTGRGGMEMFQKAMQESLEKDDKKFGDLDY